MKVRKCCVKGCTSVQRNPKISFFNATKSNYLAWNLAVSNANCEKTFVKRVCAQHFKPEEIINAYSVPRDVTNVNIIFFYLSFVITISFNNYLIQNRDLLIIKTVTI